jgi:hypothetical protein
LCRENKGYRWLARRRDKVQADATLNRCASPTVPGTGIVAIETSAFAGSMAERLL